jgi:lipoprotein-anchoring transpeptidase ErfK/SrfK
MEDEKIIDEGAHPDIGINPGGADNAGIENRDQTSTSLWQRFRDKKVLFSIARFIFGVICTLIVVLALILFILYVVPVLQESTPVKHSLTNKEIEKDPAYKKQAGIIAKDIQRLTLKVNGYTSGQSYIVVNTTENKFYLYKNKQLIREGSCSTGSYTKLQTTGGKSWIFKTPRGKFTIQGKRTHPAWHRPDWSFIEEGATIPPKDSPLRWEAGVLGDYAMDLGDSYMIHGTIYKRFLGMPVTHGCVRLNDEDLEVVFNTLNMGSKVYIF